MLLAYLRGWITSNTQKHGLQSQLRLEMILSALAAELDADTLRNGAALQASVFPAIKWQPSSLGTAIEQLGAELERAAKLKEYDLSIPEQVKQKAVTVDYLFQLYQAMMDAKVIPKADV